MNGLNWKKWLYNIGAAIIGGGATGVTGVFGVNMIDPAHFNFATGFKHDMELMGMLFVMGALTHLWAFLARNPMPEIQGMVDVAQDQKAQAAKSGQ